MALSNAKEIVSANAVVVFSKSFYPYCKRVKQLLSELGASYRAVELDMESNGSEIQAALAEWTGQRTVPNAFVKRETYWWLRVSDSNSNELLLVFLTSHIRIVILTIINR